MMGQMPEEFSSRVNHTLQRMDEQIRLGELELSLERARISRQASQLESLKHHIERNARQLGWTINPDGSIAAETGSTPKGTGSRRWLGKLGFGD